MAFSFDRERCAKDSKEVLRINGYHFVTVVQLSDEVPAAEMQIGAFHFQQPKGATHSARVATASIPCWCRRLVRCDPERMC
jgi:hypothetical protein